MEYTFENFFDILIEKLKCKFKNKSENEIIETITNNLAQYLFKMEEHISDELEERTWGYTIWTTSLIKKLIADIEKDGIVL